MRQLKLMKQVITMLMAAAMVLMLAGCGGGGESDSAPAEEAAPQKMGTDISQFSGSINGSIAFSGEAPKMRPVKMDDACGAFHTEAVMSDAVVVNGNGTLKNVFVYIKDGLGSDMSFTPPSESVIFDQKGCTYDPHVFGVMAGQNIEIRNSDPVLHNIHALPTTNRPFNFGMPNEGDKRDRSFKKAEVMVKIKCDVHPWMGAYVGVLDHPFYSVSSDDGSFTINNVPPGEYVVEAWHEKYGSQTMTVKVEAAAATADFSYAAK